MSIFRPRARRSARHVEPESYGPTGGMTTGWLPGYGTPHPSQQIGRYAGTLLNQYPAYTPGVQLHSGREWGSSAWYYPVPVPHAGAQQVQQTMRTPATPAGQRYGSLFSGPLGPLNVKAMQTNVAAQQVRQSGLAVTQWARGLSGQ